MNPTSDNDHSELNPMQLRAIEQNVPHCNNTRGESLILGGLAGGVVGALCAIGMGWIALTSGIQFGLVYIVFGALIGFTVRIAGNGYSSRFGVLAVAMTLAACLAAEAFYLASVIAKSSSDYTFFSALQDPELWRLLPEAIVSSPQSILIYLLGLAAAYKSGFRE